uniref:Uncharacterized protein n=1 Tax=Hucho hucho TaxID=62062 RepID=A0A4W5MUB7_9TELE
MYEVCVNGHGDEYIIIGRSYPVSAPAPVCCDAEFADCQLYINTWTNPLSTPCVVERYIFLASCYCPGHPHRLARPLCCHQRHGTTQPSYRSGRRCDLSPRDEHTLVRKVQINPRTTAKDLVKMPEEIDII